MAQPDSLETTADLHFPVWRVRSLLQHCTRCASQLTLDGVEAAAPGPGLVLVADTAIYLASNGVDEAPLDGPERLAFARGFEDAEQTRESIRRVAGGDDTAVFLKAADVTCVLQTSRDTDELTVRMVHDGQRLTHVLLVPPMQPIPEDR